MAGFLLKVFITNVFFGILLYMVFARFNQSGRYSRNLLFLFACGAAPAVVSVLMHYALLLVPGQSDGFYVWIIATVFVTAAAICYKSWNDVTLLGKDIANWFGRAFRVSFGGQGVSGKGIVHFLTSNTPILLVFLGLVTVWLYLITVNPIVEHDYLGYGTQARVFHATKVIEYGPHRFHEATGFYNIGLHGFGTQLMGTWELMLNSVFGWGHDLYFKSLTGYYVILIVLLVWGFIRKHDKMLAFYTVCALLGTYGFMLIMKVYHLDAFRIFLVTLTFLFSIQLVRKPDKINVLLLGLFGGLSANIHSLGVLLLCFSLLTLLVFMPGKLLQKRMPALVTIGAMCLLFGGFHYVLDVFWGTGWIFREIKFY